MGKGPHSCIQCYRRIRYAPLASAFAQWLLYLHRLAKYPRKTAWIFQNTPEERYDYSVEALFRVLEAGAGRMVNRHSVDKRKSREIRYDEELVNSALASIPKHPKPGDCDEPRSWLNHVAPPGTAVNTVVRVSVCK